MLRMPQIQRLYFRGSPALQKFEDFVSIILNKRSAHVTLSLISQSTIGAIQIRLKVQLGSKSQWQL